MLIQYLVFKSQYRATVLIFFIYFLELITNIIKSLKEQVFHFLSSVMEFGCLLLHHHVKNAQRQCSFW
jgi:phosphate starvation-inducible membrane PsiE